MFFLFFGILGFILLVFYSWLVGWKFFRRDVSLSVFVWLSLRRVGLLEGTDRRRGISYYLWVYYDN